MAWTDSLTTFVTDTAVGAAATGTAVVGDHIDLRNVSLAPAPGNPVHVHIHVTESFDSAGDGATVNFQVVSDAVSPPAVDGSATVHYQTGALAETVLTKGYHVSFTLPSGGSAYERYLGILAVTGVEKTTAGKISAYIALDGHDHWTPFVEGND